MSYGLTVMLLIAALITAAIYVDRITIQGQRAIQEASANSDVNHNLADALIAMERSARQYNILRDREIYQRYSSYRNDFIKALNQISRFSRTDKLQQRIAGLLAREEALYQQIKEMLPGSDEAARVLGQFAQVAKDTRFIQAQSERLVTVTIADLQHSAEQAGLLLIWLLIGAVPLVFIVLLLVLWLIIRPIRHLNLAIHQLGRGDFTTPVLIKGPKDLVELGNRLDWMRAKVLDLEQEKVIFLRHMSHELKTPLTSIREGSDLLVEEVVGPLNREQAEVAHLLKSNSLELQRQIENLLRFSVTQSTELNNIEPVPLGPLITRVLKDHQLPIINKALRLETELDDLCIEADNEKIRVILDNLISNAVKYSPDQGLLTVTMTRKKDWVIITVADEGPGIPEAEQRKIFDAFFQGSLQHGGVVKGTGLGLSIAKAYTKMHGGELSVNNRAQGVECCLRLPVAGCRAEKISDA